MLRGENTCKATKQRKGKRISELQQKSVYYVEFQLTRRSSKAKQEVVCGRPERQARDYGYISAVASSLADLHIHISTILVCRHQVGKLHYSQKNKEKHSSVSKS